MSPAAAALKVAVLSDTHGLLRPEVLSACTGVDTILHAGDVGDVAILEQLSRLAPVTAIRGNIDRDGPCAALPQSEIVLCGEVGFYLVHDLADIDISPVAAAIDVVVSGHSHKPHLEYRGGVLYLNPGSAGPRRFKLPVGMAVLSLHRKQIDVEQIRFDL